MKTDIKKNFSRHFPIKITKREVKIIHDTVRKFEIRKEHPMTLNGSLLGVHEFKFLPVDRDFIFTLFDVDENDVKEVIKSIDTINKSFNVTSDSFNLFCMYVCYTALNSSALNNKLKDEVITDLLLYYQYKLFGSLLSNSFRYGTDEAVMTAVVENLTNKFDIKKYKSWKEVMLARNTNLFLDKNNALHYKTIHNFHDDEYILRMVSDSQTRIRTQIVYIANIYYEYHEQNTKISSARIDIDIDGDRIIREQESSMDMMRSVILQDIKFAVQNPRYIKLLASLFTIVNENLLKKAILLLSNEYQAQLKKKTTYKTTSIKKSSDPTVTEHYIGINILIEELIASSMRILSEQSVEVDRVDKCMITLKRVFTASRMSDESLVNVKYAFKHLITSNGLVKRSASVASVIAAIQLYYMVIGLVSISKKSNK